MKELIARLREDYCSCIDGYKSRGMTDPQCSSCDSKDWREECADALESLTAENLRLAGEVSNRNSRALAGDTATKQFDAMYEDIESLTAELNSIKEKNAPEIGSINAYITNLTSERDAALAASRYETDLCQQALDTVKEVQAEVDRTIAERDALRAGLDAALDFVGTVAGGSSWWEDVWKEHDAAIQGAGK